MKIKLFTTFILIFSALSCSNGISEKQYSDLKKELENTKEELKNCSTELAEIKNTPENRFNQAKRLLADNQLTNAREAFQGIVDNFKGTDDEKIAQKEIDKINKAIEQEKAEIERKKALGYKILKPTSLVKYDDLSLRFDKIWIGKRWTFDDYGNQYFLRDAQRGNQHILARVSITSEANNPQLPPILVYKMNNGELNFLGTLDYKFRRWKDYGSYLGNYADYGNDFAHSKTIPFNLGYEISEDKLEKGKIYIVIKKQGCFKRVNSNYGNPEVAYIKEVCAPKNTLKVEDFGDYYQLLKIL